MNNWEYMIVSPYDAGGQLRPWKVNGSELTDWRRGPSIYEYINRLGGQGWELVMTREGDFYSEMVFKRPR